jgi:hypothetical protein
VVVNAVPCDSKGGVYQCLIHCGPRTRAVVTIPHDRTFAAGGDVALTVLKAMTQRADLQLGPGGRRRLWRPPA